MDEFDPTEDLQSLLDREQELTISERLLVKQLGEQTWAGLYRVLAARARAIYSQVTLEEFGTCVGEHLSSRDRAKMIEADQFVCPDCGRLLKDRSSPAVSSIVLELDRMQELWSDVLEADSHERRAALDRYRRALDQ